MIVYYDFAWTGLKPSNTFCSGFQNKQPPFSVKNLSSVDVFFVLADDPASLQRLAAS